VHGKHACIVACMHACKERYCLELLVCVWGGGGAKIEGRGVLDSMHCLLGSPWWHHLFGHPSSSAPISTLLLVRLLLLLLMMIVTPPLCYNRRQCGTRCSIHSYRQQS
jgi:hypothetical protein